VLWFMQNIINPIGMARLGQGQPPIFPGKKGERHEGGSRHMVPTTNTTRVEWDILPATESED
jgi:hypothetical protein